MNPEAEAQIADLLLWRDHDARHLLEVAAKKTQCQNGSGGGASCLGAPGAAQG